jgi:hypothetical protein
LRELRRMHLVFSEQNTVNKRKTRIQRSQKRPLGLYLSRVAPPNSSNSDDATKIVALRLK